MFDGLLEMRDDGVTMRWPILRRVITGVVMALLVGVVVMYPSTQPALIQAKARVFGPGLTYAPRA